MTRTIDESAYLRLGITSYAIFLNVFFHAILEAGREGINLAWESTLWAGRMHVQRSTAKSVYKIKRVSYGASSSSSGNGASVYYSIYNMTWLRGGRWWLFPDEVVSGSRFVESVGGDVYWLMRRFVDRVFNVDVLGVDATAGYGKSLAAVKLCVDLSYNGWLIIIAFHSHELGRKLFEYVLRYAFICEHLVGKNWIGKVLARGPLVLPRVIYIGGMERYCPLMWLLATTLICR